MTFARACIVPKEIPPACVNQHVSIIRVDPNICLKLHHRPAAIAILEQTRDMLERSDPASLFLADACFQLAEALALARRNEPRVWALAQRALTLYRTVDALRDRQREAVERFLAQRPPAKQQGQIPSFFSIESAACNFVSDFCATDSKGAVFKVGRRDQQLPSALTAHVRYG